MSSQTSPKYPHVVVPLLGEDGNAFFIMGRVSAALKRAGEREAATEYVNAAMSAPSYDDFLALTLEYVTEASIQEAEDDADIEFEDDEDGLCVECGEKTVYADNVCEDCDSISDFD